MNVKSLTAVLRRSMSLWCNSPRLRRAALILVVCELTAVIALPGLLPEQWYFDRYQDDPRAQVAIRSFFSAEHFLLPDAQAGWLNRPGVADGKWAIDEHGSRSHKAFDVAPVPGKSRVMFLGSSMINGGGYADRTETISANVATPTIETLNFGAMLYRVDQSYIAYKTSFAVFEPEVVVVGVDAYATEALTNVWIPLITRAEVNLPLVKPRFRIVDGELVSESAPLDLLRKSTEDARPLMDYLAQHDGFYFAYEDAKRFGLTPIAYAGNYLYRAAMRTQGRWVEGPPSESEELALSVMEHFRDELRTQNKKLILLLLPRRGAISGNWWTSDHREHQRTRALLDARKLFYVDAVEPLRKVPIGEVFGVDGIHYTPMGNLLIAEHLAPYLAPKPAKPPAR